MSARVLVCLTLLALPFAEQRGQLDHGRPSMTSLRASFRRAVQPKPNELVTGLWVEITTIATERFVSGGSGPEHVLFDIEGIKRPDQHDYPFDWTMRFRAVRGGLQATFESVGTPKGNRPDTAAVQFNAAGDLVFEKGYGGDGQWIYRCRAVNVQRLVCLLLDHENGHGVEFLRIADVGL
jgi:hypothetical protein